MNETLFAFFKIEDFKHLRFCTSKKFRKKNFETQMKYFQANELLHKEMDFQIDYFLEIEAIHFSFQILYRSAKFASAFLGLFLLYNHHFIATGIAIAAGIALQILENYNRNQKILSKFWNENMNIPMYRELLKQKYHL